MFLIFLPKLLQPQQFLICASAMPLDGLASLSTQVFTKWKISKPLMTGHKIPTWVSLVHPTRSGKPPAVIGCPWKKKHVDSIGKLGKTNRPGQLLRPSINALIRLSSDVAQNSWPPRLGGLEDQHDSLLCVWLGGWHWICGSPTKFGISLKALASFQHHSSKTNDAFGTCWLGWGWHLTNCGLHRYHLRFKLARGELALANWCRSLDKTRWLEGQSTNPVEQAWRKESHALVAWKRKQTAWFKIIEKEKSWTKQELQLQASKSKKKQLNLFLPVQLFCRWLLLVQHLGRAAWVWMHMPGPWSRPFCGTQHSSAETGL